MELSTRVAVRELAARGGALARHVATRLGDAGDLCFSMVLVHGRRFGWN